MKDVLKGLAEFNYKKSFCPIQILAIFSISITLPVPTTNQHVAIIDEDVAYDEQLVTHWNDSNGRRHIHCTTSCKL